MAQRPSGETASSAAPAPSAPKKDAPSAPKKKRKYSRSAGPPQKLERRISKSGHRVSKAVEKGIRTYLDERDKSSDRRRDGALIESYANVAEGLSEGINEASPAIKDVARAVNSKRTRKVLRTAVRSIPFPWPR